MPPEFLLVALAYVVFAIAVGWFEMRRTRANGIDAVSLFVAFFMLQCCLSAVAIYGLLPFTDRSNLTSVYAFDRILGQLDMPTALLVFFLTVAFLLFFYVGCSLGRIALARLWPQTRDVLLVSVNRRRISLTLLV